jgi:endonuclease/exonuclease/phosphatase family metal-dependent hydrolase
MKAKKVKKFTLVDKIVLGLNVVAALALLLGYLAPSTSPLDSSFIALLGFGFLILVPVNLVFILYWIIRKPILLLLSVISILAGYSVARSYYGLNSKHTISDKASPDDIRIMHYNVRSFKGIDRYQDLFIQKEIEDQVSTAQPDILNIVEFAKYKANRDSVAGELLDTMKAQKYYFQAFKAARGDSIGNAIFSKYPIINSGSVGTADNVLNTKAVFVDVKYKDKTIRVYCIHLAAVELQQKQKNRYLKGKVGLGSVTPIFDKVSAAFVPRSYQVSQIKRHLEDCPYPYILTGDFNDTPNSYAVNELGDGLKNAFIEKGSGLQATYFSKFPLQIDYIFTSQQFDILNYTTFNQKISDHKPVISDLKLAR